MNLPFLSMRSHRETIAAKDETIAILRETVANLTASLKAFDSLIDSMKPRPMVRRNRDGEPPTPRKPLDYANMNPDDAETVGAAALAEMGPGKHTAGEVMRRAQHIRRQIILNREAAALRAQQPGSAPPPEAVAQQISDAIAQGVAAAEAN